MPQIPSYSDASALTGTELFVIDQSGTTKKLTAATFRQYAEGAQGPQGYQGAQGATGSQGAQGDQGAQGASAAGTWKYKNGIYTAVPLDHVLADTSVAGWTLTLPASPSDGEFVAVYDYTGDWGTNNLTVNRNGNTIAGLAENYICDVNWGKVIFAWISSLNTWGYVPFSA